MPMAAATSIIVVSVLDVALTISCFTSLGQPEMNAEQLPLRPESRPAQRRGRM
jgi:hypothetical protein